MILGFFCLFASISFRVQKCQLFRVSHDSGMRKHFFPIQLLSSPWSQQLAARAFHISAPFAQALSLTSTGFDNSIRLKGLQIVQRVIDGSLFFDRAPPMIHFC